MHNMHCICFDWKLHSLCFYENCFWPIKLCPTMPCFEFIEYIESFLLDSKTSQKCLYSINFLFEEWIIVIFFTKRWFLNFISPSYTFETILSTSKIPTTFMILLSFRILFIVNLNFNFTLYIFRSIIEPLFSSYR